MNNLIGKYENGNYTVSIYEDGTKIRENDLDNLTPAFAENCDVQLTDRCSQNCSFCYAGCTPNGKHSDILNQPWINTLHPYTELALNGNDLDHPQLMQLLVKLKEQKVIANITVNQNQFMKNLIFLHRLVDADLIHGIGVSLIKADSTFIEEIKKFDNIVIHVICGIFNQDSLSRLADHDLKILILGYKQLNRGIDYYNKNESVEQLKTWLKENIKTVISKFKVVSFDNLALRDLDMKSVLSKKAWEEFYMGDDAMYTFFIDAVKKEFGRNSLAEKRYPIKDDYTIDDMFKIIRENEGK